MRKTASANRADQRNGRGQACAYRRVSAPANDEAVLAVVAQFDNEFPERSWGRAGRWERPLADPQAPVPMLQISPKLRAHLVGMAGSGEPATTGKARKRRFDKLQESE